MNKNIFTTLTLDEAVALCSVEPFHNTGFSHSLSSCLN
jgi:hypothetical protein